MNPTHPVARTAARTRAVLAAEGSRVEHAAARTGRQARHTLAPRAVAVADGLENAVDRTADHLRNGYHRLAAHSRPTPAQRRRARRLRTARFASAALVGLVGTLAWWWWAGHRSDPEFSPADDGPLSPEAAVSAVSDLGITAADDVNDSTLSSGGSPG